MCVQYPTRAYRTWYYACIAYYVLWQIFNNSARCLSMRIYYYYSRLVNVYDFLMVVSMHRTSETRIQRTYTRGTWYTCPVHDIRVYLLLWIKYFVSREVSVRWAHSGFLKNKIYEGEYLPRTCTYTYPYYILYDRDGA